jgi:hypothetical protein
VPFILVGLKIDLREDPTALETLYKQKLSPITTDEVPFARTTRCGDGILGRLSPPSNGTTPRGGG